MSVLVYIENSEGKIKKLTLEAAAYASALAQLKSCPVVGISIGKVTNEALEKVAQYGIGNIHHYAMEENEVNHHSVAKIFQEYLTKHGNADIVFAASWIAKGAAPKIAVKQDYGIVSEVVALPEGNVVKKKAFSNKAFMELTCLPTQNIYLLSANSYGLKENPSSLSLTTHQGTTSSVLQHVSYNKDTNKVALTDAEIVVSAGRGLKAPENWGMIEELAGELGAGTACSKPVSDIGWRPHSEHVGQTGISIAPNLYFAIGISGAIQHLAGVSSSKKIVVINTDPEAPFFKAADYGIVGDAFEVVPKLITAIKNSKT